MQRLPLDNAICLPLDHVIVGMEYGDVARYVSTCFAALHPFYGAQQRFSVTGDFGGDVSEETDYIFTKCRLVYIINFVDLWSK